MAIDAAIGEGDHMTKPTVLKPPDPGLPPVEWHASASSVGQLARVLRVKDRVRGCNRSKAIHIQHRLRQRGGKGQRRQQENTTWIVTRIE